MDDRRAGTVRKLLERAWREPGFCVPNGDTYPHQWLWDSCFHAVIWHRLGEPGRAVTELGNALGAQDHGSGLVPHMTYRARPDVHRDFWGRSGTSTITQPPVYGHVAAVLARDGIDPGRELSERIERGVRHLLQGRPRTPAGLIPIWHPWESGCDDSPRWDSFRRPGRTWRRTKGDLVAALIREADEGPATGSTRFAVGSVGFNALVAWNTAEHLDALARLGADPPADLAASAAELVGALAGRWDPDRATWIDDGPASGTLRTLDALLPLLVDPRPEGFDQLRAGEAFAAPFGPRGVHRDEPAYRPDEYWRGPAWPQLTYLLWVAADRAGHPVAADLARCLIAGAERSGYAEYWNPETGAGLGAVPQTWAGLALVVPAD